MYFGILIRYLFFTKNNIRFLFLIYQMIFLFYYCIFLEIYFRFNSRKTIFTGPLPVLQCTILDTVGEVETVKFSHIILILCTKSRPRLVVVSHVSSLKFAKLASFANIISFEILNEQGLQIFSC